MISCRFFSVSVNCWIISAVTALHPSSRKDSSSVVAGDESRLVAPMCGRPEADVLMESSWCGSSGDGTSSLNKQIVINYNESSLTPLELTHTNSDPTWVGWCDCALANIPCTIRFSRSAAPFFVFPFCHLTVDDHRHLLLPDLLAANHLLLPTIHLSSWWSCCSSLDGNLSVMSQDVLEVVKCCWMRALVVGIECHPWDGRWMMRNDLRERIMRENVSLTVFLKFEFEFLYRTLKANNV